MASQADEALKALDELQADYSLSIIKLSDSITFPDGAAETGTTRSSDASAANDEDQDTNPATLRADLAHYKELFSKMRFSYIEQVTKEKFLRAITADAPVFVEPAENAELEAQLLTEKAGLTTQKEQVARMIAELEARGRDLASRYSTIQLQRARLAELPPQIAGLEREIVALQDARPPSPAGARDPSQNLSLPDTLALLAEREAQLAALTAQVSGLETVLPRKTREAERLEAELGPLQKQKKAAVALAMEARRRREEGGFDEMEERGRWYKASEAALRKMLEVDG